MMSVRTEDEPAVWENPFTIDWFLQIYLLERQSCRLVFWMPQINIVCYSVPSEDCLVG